MKLKLPQVITLSSRLTFKAAIFPHFAGHFINFDVQECHTNRLFCNKIWQAVKYTNGVVGEVTQETPEWESLGPMDRWALSRLTHMVQKARSGMESHDFHVATAAIKDFMYYEFCDVYLVSKTKNGENPPR